MTPVVPEVVVLSGEAIVGARLIEALGPGVASVPGTQAAVAAISRTADTIPIVIVLGPVMTMGEAIDAFHTIRSGLPNRIGGVVGVAVRYELTIAEFRAALASGLSDAVPLGDSPEQLRHAVRRAGLAGSLECDVGGVSRLVSSGSADVEKTGRIIAVTSAKGGVGKSVLAVNLADVFGATGPPPGSRATFETSPLHDMGNAVVVDADLQFGDIATLLGVNPRLTLADVPPSTGDPQLDLPQISRMVEGSASRSCGVLVVASEPVRGDGISAETVRMALKVLSRSAEWIVVDLGTHLDDRSLDILEVVDHTLVVTTAEATSVKATGLLLDVVSRLGMDPERRSLLVNRVGMPGGLDSATIAGHLGDRPLAVIPEDISVGHSVLAARPAVAMAPDSPFSVAVLTLASDISGDAKAGTRREERGLGARVGRWFSDVVAPRGW